MARARSAKFEIDKTRRARAAAKRDRRQQKDEGVDGEPSTTTDAGPPISEEELLERLRELHDRYDAELIDFDQFEEAKAELLANLRVD